MNILIQRVTGTNVMLAEPLSSGVQSMSNWFGTAFRVKPGMTKFISWVGLVPIMSGMMKFIHDIFSLNK